VDGIYGATILEVLYEESSTGTVDAMGREVGFIDQLGHHSISHSSHLKITDLEKEKSGVESSKLALDDDVHVLRKRLEVLDGVASQVGQNVCLTKSVLVSTDASDAAARGEKGLVGPASTLLLCEDAMKNLTAFLDYYGRVAGEMKRELRDKEKQASLFRGRIDSMERALDRQRCRHEYDNHRRYLTVQIEGGEQGGEEEVELHLVYQVYCAGWRPYYDIRASTSSDAVSAPSSVSMLYYGLVEQKSDEDWADADIVLSTEAPCLSGALPQVRGEHF